MAGRPADGSGAFPRPAKVAEGTGGFGFLAPLVDCLGAGGRKRSAFVVPPPALASGWSEREGGVAVGKSWLRKSEQRDKWSFCLTAASMHAAQEKQ